MSIEVTCSLSISRRIRIGTNTNVALFICPFHQGLKCVIKCCFLHRDSAQQNLPRRTINCDDLTLFKNAAICQNKLFLAWHEPNVGYTNDTGQTNAAPDDGSMTCDPAPLCQNGACGVHSTNIFG